MTIALDGVRFAYGDHLVLDGVTASADGGAVVALMGPNGVGKTTLTKLLVALLVPAAGRIRVAGRDPSAGTAADLADAVAYVFQHPARQLFARTVLDEVAFGPRQRGGSARAWHAAAREALAVVGIGAMEEHHPHDLPPGDQKLVALAAALAQRPQVLILDEPTQGLDRAGMLRIARLVRERAEAGVTVLAVSHDPAFVAESCDRVWVLADGRLGADEPASAVLTSPRRSAELGLEVPDVARLSAALSLPGRPMRYADAIEAVKARRAGRA